MFKHNGELCIIRHLCIPHRRLACPCHCCSHHTSNQRVELIGHLVASNACQNGNRAPYFFNFGSGLWLLLGELIAIKTSQKLLSAVPVARILLSASREGSVLYLHVLSADQSMWEAVLPVWRADPFDCRVLYSTGSTSEYNVRCYNVEQHYLHLYYCWG
jgi:hypothetical protein